MAKITYMPSGEDMDCVEVAGITFKAYEPTEVPDQHGELVSKLKRNAWFTSDEADPARKTQWSTVRNAQQLARQHRKIADMIENNPAAAAASSSSLHAQANSVVSDAAAEADRIVAAAEARADMLVAEATKKASEIATDAAKKVATTAANSAVN